MGACDFIKSIAEVVGPKIVDLYVLDTPAAAVGVSRDERHGSVLKALCRSQALA